MDEVPDRNPERKTAVNETANERNENGIQNPVRKQRSPEKSGETQQRRQRTATSSRVAGGIRTKNGTRVKRGRKVAGERRTVQEKQQRVGGKCSRTQ